MEKMAKIERITIPENKRVICISDIHGALDLFKRLLEKVKFSDDDILILLGDYYLKGPQNHETLKYVMELSQKDNVHALRGNCDAVGEILAPYADFTMEPQEIEWAENLPHIIESQDYIFVHGGLTSENLHEQQAMTCMKNDAFMEKGLIFSKWLVTGHWPVNNYCHKIACYDPIVNEEQKIIAIDGGMGTHAYGQLNAFIIFNGSFSFDSVDDFPLYQAEKSQVESGGNLHITWNDRFVELVERGEDVSVYRHVATGVTLSIPDEMTWVESDGKLAAAHGTDYFLPVTAGETVSAVKWFGDRIYAKKNGVCGWIGVDSA
ncbi:MAG: metallophosphoesterase [Oscillospiraceae bacterium]|nr:metallophosphoesterase [Oscillospiraceae bacterium]